MIGATANNIFLVGPMGVGKTTIGKALAREAGLEFIDSDQEIERRAGADAAWIFDVEGEEGFRDRETHVLEDLTAREGILLATGGGSILREKNRRMLKARGFVIFLDTSVELQLKRTAKDKKRPLLQRPDRESVLVTLREQRLPLYEEVADHRVFVGDTSSRRLVTKLLEELVDNGFTIHGSR